MNRAKHLVILPTYNERDNISVILDEIEKLNLGFDFLVVDDNSPDGTREVVKELMAQKKNLFLLEREKKEGLGKAYIAGFLWGMKHGYENLIQMDADLSHDPKDLIKMLETLKISDVAIGSRYISHGGTIGWSRIREYISRGGNSYAKLVLGVPYDDMTGGFNGWKKTALEIIGLETVESKGYAFQVEMKYRAFKKQLRITEFPIVFRNRLHGVSKMNHHIIIEAAIRVLKIKNIH